ncbi:hypothetical protein ACFLZ1_04870 [Patescibacteria group bacterium]
MKRLLVFFIWLPSTILTLVAVTYFHTYRSFLVEAKTRQSENLQVETPNESYKMYAALPKTLGVSTTSVKTEDAVPELVYQYLKRYKSPMTDTADAFVRIFRSYNINPVIPLAIAQCESNLGKKMPEDCINPFGLGIHSRGKLCFENWEQGYEKMGKVLKEDYIDKGFVTVEEIMGKYCPLSLEKGGSWAKCVSQFSDDIETLTIQK